MSDTFASHQIVKDLGEMAKEAEVFKGITPMGARKIVVISQALETLEIIEQLREQEGSSLTLFSPNADFNGLPNCMIELSNDHTGYSNVQFTGDTLLDCLRDAKAMMDNKDLWKKEPPTEPGKYLFRSDENREAMVYEVKLDNGVLRVHSEIGAYPVDMFHYNLENPEWARIAKREPKQTECCSCRKITTEGIICKECTENFTQ